MPLFKKSNEAQRQAELELQQSTLHMISSDVGASPSSYQRNNPGPWYTPTTINSVPYRSSTPQTSVSRRSSSPGFSPASTTASRATSRASSPQSTIPPKSPPPVIVTPPATNSERPNFNNRTSAEISTRQSHPAQRNQSYGGAPGQRNPSYGDTPAQRSPSYGGTPAQRSTPSYGRTSMQRTSTATPRLDSTSSRKDHSILSKISSIKVPNVHISNPLKKKGKDETDISKTRRSPSSSANKGSIPSRNGASSGMVTVKTRDGEVSKSGKVMTTKPNQETVNLQYHITLLAYTIYINTIGTNTFHLHVGLIFIILSVVSSSSALYFLSCSLMFQLSEGCSQS